MNNREVWITGIGLVSCFGEGAGHHWETLGGKTAPAPVIDSERFKPYSVHPLPEMDWSKQIPRRGDQRQMENWQRLGTYTAGLAHEYAGLFSNSDTLAAALDAAGKSSGDKLWRFPMGQAYDKQLDSPIADMKNVGTRFGGSITAAQFLKRFVENDTPWAHLDIAGTVWTDKPGATWDKGATGFGVRLLDRYVADVLER